MTEHDCDLKRTVEEPADQVELLVLATVDELFHDRSPRRYQELTLPVSGKRIRFQSLYEDELSAYQAVTMSSRGFRRSRLEDANRRLLTLCLVNAQGRRLLTAKQADKFKLWDAADSQVAYDAVIKHVGINREDIEDLIKNSEKTTVDG